jgi:DNA-binding FadR family transcriptional regulator
MVEKRLVEKTVDEIINYIITNDIQPRQKLPTENELGKRLGVGRSTVREAIKALIGRNILEARQGAGTFVVEHRLGISQDPLGLLFIKDKRKLTEDLVEVRMMIEPRTAALAAMTASEKDIAEMQTLASEIEELVYERKDHTQKDIELHMKIAESSGNIVLPSLLPVIQQAIRLFINMPNQKLRTETIQGHRAIVDAIASHNSVAASDAMTLHIVYHRNNITKSLGELFPDHPPSSI